MPIITAIVLGLTSGVIFGVALEKARVFEPGLVIGQAQLRNFTLIKVWFTAAATALIAVTLCKELGMITLHPKPLLVTADIMGGFMVGAGLVIAGGCPAMLMAQLGVGYRDAWFALAGGVAGVVTVCAAEPKLRPALEPGLGPITIPDISTMPFSAWGVAIAVALFACIIALERLQPWPADLDPEAEDMLPARRSAPAEPTIEFYDPELTPTHEVISPSDPR
jgi:hypothetical protein